VEEIMLTRRSFIANTAAVAALSSVAPVGTAGAAEKWKHAMVAAKGDAAFFYMAKEKGFWAKRGLDVEIVELKGSKDVVRALLSGEADSADANPSDVYPAVVKGADIRFVGSAIESYPYAMYVRPEIKSWADLKGKVFGVSSPGSAPHMFALAMMEHNHIPTADMQIANSGGTTPRIKALVAGKLDATAASSEYVPLADKLHIKVLGLAKDEAPLFPRFFEIMKPSTITERKEAAVQFLAGYMEGLRYCIDHRDEAIKLSAKIIQGKADDPRLIYAFDEIVEGKMVSLNMDIRKDKLDWMQNMMIRLKRLPKPVDIASLIDTSLRDKALQIVGKR
jgi:NitT/TauT family transport system substrate-binding protein